MTNEIGKSGWSLRHGGSSASGLGSSFIIRHPVFVVDLVGMEATTTSNANVRTWCVLAHASALLGFVVPYIFHIVGPLVVWLVKRGDSPEIDAHGKESVNFQISMLIYNLIAGLLCLVLIGFVFLVVLHFLNLVLVIVASVRASEGKLYRYPVSIRLIR